MPELPYGPQYPQPDHPAAPPGKPNPEHRFEDRIRLGRDIVVGAVLALACAASFGASAWYSMFVADAFWTPIPVTLLGAGILLLLVQVWYFVLREGRTVMMAAGVIVHLALFAMPLLVFIGVNEQVLSERGVTETCTVTSEERTYVRSDGERRARYDHTLDCPTAGELSHRTKTSGLDVGDMIVITYDPEGRAGHRTGEPSNSPLTLFGGIAAAAFAVGTVARVIYLNYRVKRGASRRATGGVPSL